MKRVSCVKRFVCLKRIVYLKRQAGSAELETIEDKYYENLFNSNEVPLLKLGSTRSKLFVDCVSDKSVGEYICVAETPENRIKKTFTVRLQQQQQQLHGR